MRLPQMRILPILVQVFPSLALGFPPAVAVKPASGLARFGIPNDGLVDAIGKNRKKAHIDIPMLVFIAAHADSPPLVAGCIPI